MMGLYGPVFFHSGSTGLCTFDEMKKTVTARWGEHAVHLSSPLLEYSGPQLIEVAFRMELITPWTVDPLGTIILLEGIMDAAIPLPLIVGMKPMGRGLSLFVLTSLSHEMKYFYSGGGLMGASVEVQLKEYPSTSIINNLMSALGGVFGGAGLSIGGSLGPISAGLSIGAGGITPSLGIGTDVNAGPLSSALSGVEQTGFNAVANQVVPQIAQNAGNPVPLNIGFSAPSTPASPPSHPEAVVSAGD